MKKLIVLGLLALAGCSLFKDTPPAEGLRLACEGFASELNILAPMRADGTLPKTAVDIVNYQKSTVDPICGGAAPDINADTGTIVVKSGIQALTALAGQFVKE